MSCSQSRCSTQLRLCEGHHQACYQRGKISQERIRWVYGMEGEKRNRREESKLSRKEQTTMGRLSSGHHPELKHLQHKIGRAVDSICRKCGIEEKTAEHVVYECPSIHHPPHEPTPPDTLAKDPQKVLQQQQQQKQKPIKAKI